VSAGPNPPGDADRNGSQRRNGVARGRPAGPRTAKRGVDGERIAGRSGRPQNSRGNDDRAQGSGRPQTQRRGEATPDGELARLALPADADGSELDRDVRQELLTLPKGLAELVGSHLVMAARLLDEDPELALAHARFARSKAGRVAAVREVAGLSAYHAGEWSEALAELRAARRLGGDTGRLAVLADCERALGRPERALEIARSPEARQLGTEESVELRIVAAGARRDLGQFDAAVIALQGPDLEGAGEEPWRARLRYAYADNLLAAGREQDAIRWFLSAAEADLDEATDAAERAVELSERPAPE
jgi:tetratricopeptide (TPR) repeat protein